MIDDSQTVCFPTNPFHYFHYIGNVIVLFCVALVEKFEKEPDPQGPSATLLKEAVITCRQMEAFLRILLVCVSSHLRRNIDCKGSAVGTCLQDSLYHPMN